MNKMLQRLSRTDMAVLLFTISFVGLLYSKWFLSICLLALLPLGLIDISFSPTFKIGFRKGLKDKFSAYLSYPPYYALGFLVLIILINALWSGTSDYWMDRIRIKAPLLLAPMLIALVPPLSKRQVMIWMYGVLGIGMVSLSLVLINYFLNVEMVLNELEKGRHVPTPTNHIRYSLFIVLCFANTLWLLMDKGKEGFAIGKKTLLFVAIFFFAGLHLLAVRSGILAAYLCLFVALLFFVFQEKKWKMAIVTLLILLATPFIAYRLSPTLQAKIGYTLYDLKQFTQGDGAEYSDSERLVSLRLGWDTFLENKMLGSGVATFPDIIRSKNIDTGKFKMPHNQYITFLASMGLLGFVVCMIGLLTPLFWKRNYRFFPLAALFAIVLSSMLFENTIENTVGLNLFLWPLLMYLSYLSGISYTKPSVD